MEQILGGLASLGSLVCWIMVLVKFFQTKNVVHGVLGIVTCSIWAFIWGWVTHAKLSLTKIMIISFATGTATARLDFGS
ncbi:MAG: hypothetical protein O2894_12780 [Planctomycetota bacterium]|nr:hypothetical protein [Planctomycetota bacterium]